MYSSSNFCAITTSQHEFLTTISVDLSLICELLLLSSYLKTCSLTYYLSAMLLLSDIFIEYLIALKKSILEVLFKHSSEDILYMTSFPCNWFQISTFFSCSQKTLLQTNHLQEWTWALNGTSRLTFAKQLRNLAPNLGSDVQFWGIQIRVHGCAVGSINASIKLNTKIVS